MYESKGVMVINICNWLTAAYGEEYWDRVESQPDYDQVNSELMRWCADNNSAYWAAPKEDFSYQEAVQFAKDRGHKMVVVEDLS